MNKRIIAANWKMNKDLNDSKNFFKKFFSLKTDFSDDIIVCPPFIDLGYLCENFKNSGVKFGAQNCYYEDSGAFTGEVSASMIKKIGADYVIIGHSERRTYFGEDDHIINKKVSAALKNGLKVILCVGEDLSQREQKKEFEVVLSQIKQDLDGLKQEDVKNIIIAYEPIWAIGTGKTIFPQQADLMCKSIKEFVKETYKTSSQIKVLYGGSLKISNASDFFKMQNVDGGLIGGASLDPEEFIKIIIESEKTSKGDFNE